MLTAEKNSDWFRRSTRFLAISISPGFYKFKNPGYTQSDSVGRKYTCFLKASAKIFLSSENGCECFIQRTIG